MLCYRARLPFYFVPVERMVVGIFHKLMYGSIPRRSAKLLYFENLIHLFIEPESLELVVYLSLKFECNAYAFTWWVMRNLNTLDSSISFSLTHTS